MIDRGQAFTPIALAAFFSFGTAMTALAGVSLAWPGGPTAAMWRWKPDEYRQLISLGPLVPVGFGILSGAMAATAYGALQRRLWGWRLAVIIFAANGLADATRAVADKTWEDLIGVAIVTLILWWLMRRDVSRLFNS